METNDTDRLFQSTAQLQENALQVQKKAARATLGDPVVSHSKVLDFSVEGDAAFVAESSGVVRRVSLNSGSTTKVYRGHNGPVTSIVTTQIPGRSSEPSAKLVITGSWDKSIKVWESDTGRLSCSFEAHSDFVKALSLIEPTILLSTSADRIIRIWDLEPLQRRGKPLLIQTLTQHTRPVNCAATCETSGPGVQFCTGDSLGTICVWSWRDGKADLLKTWNVHATSVMALQASDNVIISASSDKSAIWHGHGLSHQTMVVKHDCGVTAVCRLPDPTSSGRDLLVTGTETGEIRLWDLTSEDDHPALLSQLLGHADVVTRLLLWNRAKSIGGESRWMLLSSSLDATLKRWTWEDLINPPLPDVQSNVEENGVELTQDEERELQELMDT